MKFMSKANKFRHLPRGEKVLFLLILATLFLVRAGLSVLPFLTLQKIILKLASFKPFRQQNDLLTTGTIIRIVRQASRFVPFATCLTQALTGLLFIQLNGEEADLKFGVSIDLNQQFAAHAWLEREGKIILGKVPEHRKYKTLEPPKYAVL
jgi:hypothetical protein